MGGTKQEGGRNRGCEVEAGSGIETRKKTIQHMYEIPLGIELRRHIKYGVELQASTGCKRKVLIPLQIVPLSSNDGSNSLCSISNIRCVWKAGWQRGPNRNRADSWGRVGRKEPGSVWRGNQNELDIRQRGRR